MAADRKDAIWSIFRQPVRLEHPGMKPCGVACLTVPDSHGSIICNLAAGHDGEHARVLGRGNWRSWPQNQTEPIPLQ